jgi:hypothetical protein
MPAKKPPAPALLSGPYAAPPCERGSRLHCQIRGWVKVDGMTGAPVPWPWTHDTAEKGRGGKRSIVLCGDLMSAVRTESAQSVAHHWGVDRKTVYRWRQALGVQRFTLGTTARYRELAPGKLHGKSES